MDLRAAFMICFVVEFVVGCVVTTLKLTLTDAEMRERCAKVAEESQLRNGQNIAAAIRGLTS